MDIKRIVYSLGLLASLLGTGWFGWQAWQAWQSPQVVVEWSTATELDTIGYNLYRSETADGEYLQVNPQLIPASTDPLTGGEYEYLDLAVQAGRRYYYLLEDLDAAGNTTRHGPIEVEARGVLGWEAAVSVFCLGMAGVLSVFLFPRRPDAPDTAAHESESGSLPG